MKKKYLLILILLLTLGFASINTVLDLKGNVSIGFKEDDFNVEISKVLIDEGNTPITLSDDKQSFTFTGTGNNKIEYKITNKSYQYDANVNLVCEPNNNLLINQVGEVVAQSKKSETIEATNSGLVTCRMDIDKISKTEIAEKMCAYEEGQTWEFDYTGGEQEFIVPCDGEYKLETWGAQGGTANSTYAKGGYGAYATGSIILNENKKLYINIGGAGKSNYNSTTTGAEGGYNGGGSSGYTRWPIIGAGNAYLASGGGATHISEKTGLLKELMSFLSQVDIIAGGGGAGFFHDNFNLHSYGDGGHAGGVTGNNGQINNSGYTYGYGGTQSSGGGSSKVVSAKSSGFGYGAYVNTNEETAVSGGGSGYYGGGVGVHAGAGGGSSYIGNPLLTNKAMYCYNCTASNEVSTKTISTTCTSSTPTANCAKQGNGYAKITYLG